MGKVKIKGEKKRTEAWEIKEKKDSRKRVTVKEQVAENYFSENENSKTKHNLKTKQCEQISHLL